MEICNRLSSQPKRKKQFRLTHAYANPMAVNIITYINTVKNYVRRYRQNKYAVTVTMFSQQGKAMDFGTEKHAQQILSKWA